MFSVVRNLKSSEEKTVSILPFKVISTEGVFIEKGRHHKTWKN